MAGFGTALRRYDLGIGHEGHSEDPPQDGLGFGGDLVVWGEERMEQRSRYKILTRIEYE